MRILVICDDRWHPASVVREGLTPLAGAGFSFDFVERANDWSAEAMGEYPLVLFTKANNAAADDETPWVDEKVEQAFVHYVQRGGGLLVVHSGTAGYRETTTLRALFGGVFTRHPKQCPVEVQPLKGHPLCRDSAAFKLVDEHYFMELDDEGADVFMQTQSEHGTQPGGWTRSKGRGKVCVLSPGHNLEVWLHPSYQALLSNAIHFCAPESQ